MREGLKRECVGGRRKRVMLNAKSANDTPLLVWDEHLQFEAIFFHFSFTFSLSQMDKKRNL